LSACGSDGGGGGGSPPPSRPVLDATYRARQAGKDAGANAIAFSRGDKGFVVINHETTALSRSFVTGLAAGKYCDVLGGGANAGACVGQMVIVGADGRATVSLAANTALILQTGVSVP
jgi:alpha-amylase